MGCPSCDLPYERGGCSPKVLPCCGQSWCLDCLESHVARVDNRCPFRNCRQDLTLKPSEMITCVALIEADNRLRCVNLSVDVTEALNAEEAALQRRKRQLERAEEELQRKRKAHRVARQRNDADALQALLTPPASATSSSAVPSEVVSVEDVEEAGLGMKEEPPGCSRQGWQDNASLAENADSSAEEDQVLHLFPSHLQDEDVHVQPRPQQLQPRIRLRTGARESLTTRPLASAIVVVERVEPQPPPPPRRARPGLRMDLEDLSSKNSRQQIQEKESLLERVGREGVVRLSTVWSDKDPLWILRLLQAAAPSLEQLQVCMLKREHLQVVRAMPRLTRLALDGQGQGQGANADELPAFLSARQLAGVETPPPTPGPDEGLEDVPGGGGGLKWLTAYYLPYGALLSLLRVHRDSLETLWLSVGTRGDRRWPLSCSRRGDVAGLLRAADLRAARKVVLWRRNVTTRSRFDHGDDCADQLAAVRGVLPPATQVLCGECDEVDYEPF